jgi:hypothetical protein
MHTLGTAAIEQLKNTTTSTPLKAALEGKIIGYVGTAAERTGTAATDDTPAVPGTMASPRAVFFQRVTPTSTNCSVWVPSLDYPYTWTPAAGVDITIPIENISAASGIFNGLYAIPRGRGNPNSLNVYKYPGLLFYDLSGMTLYMCQEATLGEYTWVPISGSAAGGSSVPVGTMCVYAESLGSMPNEPLVPNMEYPENTKWLRCTGVQVPRAGNEELYDVCKSAFGPESPTQFYLPNFNNMIIRKVR